MKKLHVADLKDGDAVTIHLLVREKEIRTSARTGKSWLELSLADSTGSIPAKMWDNFEPIAKTFERDDVIQVRARVKLYNNQKELTLEQILPVHERDYDLADFLPHTSCDVEELFKTLRDAISAMKNPWLQRLLASIVEDPVLAPKLKRAPAAMTMHHAYLGGLLEHLVSLIGLSRGVTAHYPELDADLLLAGIVLHDIGKTDELRYTRAIDYSTEGRLLGHISIGLLLVREKIKGIPGFPEPLATVVEHLILSHHGSHEFGSPALPQVSEAVVLHFLDDVDSKMASMRGTLEASPSADGEWTDRNPSLRRALLRTGAYLKSAK
ncbi:MAG TPA: OB-fold nucleic acid binding domain-containing protein [Verrucomicrobiae bacterium]|nr:OB-fold nucleic acid binding domain-containing protein [Verrucomicrobiae bacterium]